MFSLVDLVKTTTKIEKKKKLTFLSSLLNFFLQMGHAVKGKYYEKQLRPAPTPGKDFSFEVKFY
jgi:hypothetical protein